MNDLIDDNSLVVFRQPVTYFGDMHERLGETIADQIRRYRKQRDMSVRELAEECARIAPETTLTQGVLNNIERGVESTARRGRREVTVEELFTLSAALRVAPILIICPLTAPGRIQIMPGTIMDSPSAIDWINGDDLPHLRQFDGFDDFGPEYVASGIDAYTDELLANSLPLHLLRQHHEANSAVRAALARHIESVGALVAMGRTSAALEAAIATTQNQLEALRVDADAAVRAGDIPRGKEIAFEADMAVRRLVLATSERDQVAVAEHKVAITRHELRTALDRRKSARDTMQVLDMPLPALGNTEDAELFLDQAHVVKHVLAAKAVRQSEAEGPSKEPNGSR